MAVLDQLITDQYALYHGDCCEVLESLPDESVGLSIHSPPFALPKGGALYHYSSSERDLSNARTYQEFMEHYGFVVRQLYRLTPPGRLAAVHCMDLPGDGANLGGDTSDFPGDLIKLYKSIGWRFSHRHFIWKEPLAVRNRTMAKELAHCQVVDDSTLCGCAIADQLLLFRKPGKNAVKVSHPVGLLRYAGESEMPAEYHRYRAWEGKQTENKFSHTIWRRYASAFWYDIRLDRVLPYLEARDPEDEKHCHPLQLDVIERAVVMYSNPGEVVLTPFAGVGSEVYGAVINGRRGVGCELKPVYFRQALANLKEAKLISDRDEPNPLGTQTTLLDIFPELMGDDAPAVTATADPEPLLAEARERVLAEQQLPSVPAEEVLAPLVAEAEEPTWRSMLLVNTGWEDEIEPYVWAAIREYTHVGELVADLQSGEVIGLEIADLQTLYALVEQLSSDDEHPVKFGLTPEPKPAAKPTPTGLGLVLGFPKAALAKLGKQSINTLSELREKADALPTSVDADVRMYAVIRGAGVSSSVAHAATYAVLYSRTRASALDLERAAKRLADPNTPYGWEITYATHAGTEEQCHYVGTEASARRKAKLKTGAKAIIKAQPFTERQWVQAFGRGRM